METDRFWSKVDYCSGDCWEWKAALTGTGYGNFFLNGKWRPAHKVSWEISQGEVPRGLFVLHKCDNRKCVNPYHLFLGTAKDNTQDMLSKGRGKFPGSVRGEKSHLSKLNESKVIEIRKMFESCSQKEIALRLGIHKNTVCDIVRRRTWKHI